MDVAALDEGAAPKIVSDFGQKATVGASSGRGEVRAAESNLALTRSPQNQALTFWGHLVCKVESRLWLDQFHPTLARRTATAPVVSCATLNRSRIAA
jgi:hypothetical protein